MHVKLMDLVRDLETLLIPDTFRDYCPNGLQVQGKAEVGRIVTGVTACQDLIERAIQWQADAILVHHGYFWRGESQPIVGMKYQRLASLIKHDISLLAYHLPLDAHPEYGNNARFGRLLGAVDSEPIDADPIGNIGRFSQATTLAQLGERIAEFTGRTPLVVGDTSACLRRVAWCTGAAQDYIERAHAAGADVYVTGEVSERTVHSARELGIAFIAAGHHASERYGVQAVGEWVQERYGIEHRYIEVDNPA